MYCNYLVKVLVFSQFCEDLLYVCVSNAEKGKYIVQFIYGVKVDVK